MRNQTTLFSIILLLLVIASNIVAKDYSEWAYSKNIVLNTLDKNDIEDDIENLPVLIHLDKKTFNFSEVSGLDAPDIRFSTSDGTPLSYYVEEWDSQKKKAQIWIMVNIVYQNLENQHIVMYWGNGSAESESNETPFSILEHDLVGIWNLKNIKDLDKATKKNTFKIFNKTKNENKKFKLNKRWSK